MLLPEKLEGIECTSKLNSNLMFFPRALRIDNMLITNLMH